jgi:hypothetical protein
LLSRPDGGTFPNPWGSGGSIKVKSRSFERSFLLAAGLTLVLAWACSSPVATPIGAPLPPEDCAGAAAATDAVFMIGDAGAPRLPIRDTGELTDPVLLNLRDDVREQTERLGDGHVTVVFLGDNVYWDGLSLEGERGRRQGERILEAQIAASDPASAIFVMGNRAPTQRAGSIAAASPESIARPDPESPASSPGGTSTASRCTATPSAPTTW